METEVVGTVWEIPDDLWPWFEQLLKRHDRAAATGRPRAPARPILNGIVFRLRSGCQWNKLPKEFGDDSTIHRTFQRWVRLGLFRKLWAKLVRACDDLRKVSWRWQSADAAMGKARFGGGPSAPTPRIVRRTA